ncbi:uncharacterized protein LOC123664618 [Melitaea cinxia]|uniref:uncharacterized protein LOC123664618 n=1 Tax=Melitaea cinxia TaxID=113334 RepID=UPI001E2702D5|nr:uncharacterized protein LOC123664618 [Melitaea cinxia]
MIDQPSAENEKALCDRKKIDAVLNQCKLHKKLCQSFKELQEYIVKRQIVTIKLTKYNEKEHEFYTKLRKSQNDVKEHKEILNKVEKSIREKTMQANEKKVTLKQKCHNKLPNEKDFPYRKDFDKLPNDLEDLQDHRYQLETRMDLISSNAQEIEHYEKNLQEISELEQELSRNRDSVADLEESSDRLK